MTHSFPTFISAPVLAHTGIEDDGRGTLHDYRMQHRKTIERGVHVAEGYSRQGIVWVLLLENGRSSRKKDEVGEWVLSWSGKVDELMR